MLTARDRGADALVAALVAAGCRRVFALSGNHVMPVFDAMIGSGIELLHTRHEAAAVHMADAYARVTGEVGVALVTGGPGHANAVSALYTALLAESPVLLLSGHAPNPELGMGAFQEMAQADLAAPLAKASWTCRAAEDIARDVERALRLARGGRPGPVHLSLPTDCLEKRVSQSLAPETDTRSMALGADDAAAIVERLRAARAPLILAGPAALTKRGRLRMQALEEALRIPVVGMESPRGLNDPSLGAFAEILPKADCVLLLGKRLDFTLKFGRAPAFDPGGELMQVDAEAAEIDRTARAVGPRLVLSAVAEPLGAADVLARAHGRGASSWLDEVRAAIAYRPASWASASSRVAERMHPVQVLRPIQPLLDAHPDAILVCDGGEFGQWALACLRAPNRIINGVAGAIGVALPFAIGARVARPDVPVFTLLGDGTFGFHAAEVDTAVRHGLPFVAVVGNDARWNAEYQIQLREYGPQRAKGCELLPTRYDEVAIAFGAHGEHVTRPSDMLRALARAQAAKAPAVVNAMIEGVPAPVISSTAR